MRLIDADKLSADMYHEAFEKDSDMQKWDSGCWIRYKMFENVLKAQPTVEAPDINVGNMDTTTHESIPAETGKNDGDRTSGDCISRQAALNLFPDDNLYWDTNEGYFAPHYVRTLLRNLPSIQPEHKTGHWIPVTNGRGGHQCDKCGCYAPSYQSGTEWLSNFCPECNADMRGDKHETD